MDDKAKKKAWDNLVQDAPHKAYLADRERFVRDFNESRQRQFEGQVPAMSRRQIEEVLHNTRPGVR